MRSLAAFVRRINLRYWLRHRLRTSLTVFGVVTGVTLVVAIAVINSTLLTTIPDTAKAVAGDADIEVAGADSTGLDDALVERIARVDGVKAAVPVLRSYTTLHEGGRSQRVLVVGTKFGFHWLFHDAVTDGALNISGEMMSRNGLLLATDTGEKLDVSIGDLIEADTPTGRAPVIVGGDFSGELVERLETGDLAIMSLKTAQEVFDRQDSVDSIYVVAEDGTDVATLEDDVAAIAGPSAITGAPGTRVQGFEDTLNGIAALTSLAGTVALFVSAFVVFNTMSMSIVERRREISLTLALGATRKQVIAGFVGEAAVLGFVASVIGITVGYFLAKVMVQPGLDGLRIFTITAVAGASLSWAHVVLGLASGVIVSLIASYVPARKILRVAPVEALRPHGAYRIEDPDSTRPSRLKTVITWIVGLVLMIGFLISGPLVGSELNNATWVSNASLVGLLGSVTLILPHVVRGTLRGLKRLMPPSGGVAIRLALESLYRNASRTTMTIGALAFTLGTVVAVGGSLESYRAEWGRLASAWRAAPIQVSSPSYVSLGSDQPLPVEFGETLEGIPGVRAAYTARYRIVNVDGRQTTIYVMPYVEQMNDPGMPEYGDEDRDRIGSVLAEGKTVISALASMKKEVGIGDMVEIPTPSGIARFEVGDITNDLNPLDSMYLSNEMFLEHWQVPAVDRFEVTVEEGFTRSQVMADIREAARDAGIPMVVQTREELSAESFRPIDQVFSVARAVQLVALIVAALAIANTMFITVMERRWELGLQRAVGMDGGSVTRTLIAEAGTIGVIGALGAWAVGITTGAVMLEDMERSYAFSFPYLIPFGLMGLTLAVGALIALFACVYPSRAAMRTSIVEALRFE